MRILIKHQLPAVGMAVALVLGGCSAQNRDVAKTVVPTPPAADTVAELADLRAENELMANTLALMSAMVVLEATSAMLPPVMAGSGAPAVAAAAPRQMAMPAAEPEPVEPLIVYVQVPVPAETAPTVVNNYYVQEVVAPAEQPVQVVYVGGVGRPAQSGRNTRGATVPAQTSPAQQPGQVLSSGSMVARALPLNVGSMVARGSGLTTGPTTTGVPLTPGTGSTASASSPQRGGRNGGG